MKQKMIMINFIFQSESIDLPATEKEMATTITDNTANDVMTEEVPSISAVEEEPVAAAEPPSDDPTIDTHSDVAGVDSINNAAAEETPGMIDGISVLI